MTRKATKAINNIYYKSRIKASKKNPQLLSREGASELLGISKDSLNQYELGMCKNVPLDRVVAMSREYEDDSLLFLHCKHKCPVGKEIYINNMMDDLTDDEFTEVLKFIKYLKYKRNDDY